MPLVVALDSVDLPDILHRMPVADFLLEVTSRMPVLKRMPLLDPIEEVIDATELLAVPQINICGIIILGIKAIMNVSDSEHGGILHLVVAGRSNDLVEWLDAETRLDIESKVVGDIGIELCTKIES